MMTNKISDATLSRRQLALLSVAAGLDFAIPRIACAGVATPGDTPSIDSMGYPSLTVTISQAGMELPETIPGGLTHVTVVNRDLPEGEHMVWMRLPDDTTPDDVLADLAASTETSPVPDWWREAQIVGGPDWAFPGRDAVGIVGFIPGTYALINIFGSQIGFLDVAEPDDDAVVETPIPDYTVSMIDYAFQGIPDTVLAGQVVVEVHATGATFHEVAFLPVESGTTEEDVMALYTTESPDATFAPVGGVGVMTPGLTTWIMVDFAPGTYAAVCSVPDDWEGPPHVMLGMLKVFTVV